MSKLKNAIVAYARSLGFERVGITSAEPLQAAENALGKWLDAGYAGEMGYMERNWPQRARPDELLPGAKSVIALAMSYFNPSPESSVLSPEPEKDHSALSTQDSARPSVGRIARYAWGKDYHRVIEKRLKSLVRYIDAMVPGERSKTFVDSGPLLERAAAQRAGLGFMGKNTMLITQGRGSYVFLASVLTTLELPADVPDTRTCGSCTLCIEACPTQAITGPYHVDARRCIAYLTIESKGETPNDLRSHMSDWLFGCDICQDVCPHNTRLAPTPVAEFHPSAGAGPTLNLAEVLALKTDAEFEARFAGTPLKRAKRQGLQRNARRIQETP